MTMLIPGNTIVPSRKEKEFTTYYDNQVAVVIRVYERESESTLAI